MVAVLVVVGVCVHVCIHAWVCMCTCREWGLRFQSIWAICRQTGASAVVLVSKPLTVAAGELSRDRGCPQPA